MGAPGSDDEGWEALPSARATAETYASEVRRQRRAAARDHAPQGALLLQQLAAARDHAPSAPPEDGSFHAGGGSFHAGSGSFYGGGSSLYADHADRHSAPGGVAYASSMRQLQALQQQHPGAHPGGAAGAPSRSQVDVLLLDPPTWLPDSYASHCGGCHLPFKPLLRLRHHCRLCGKVFCHACASKRLLLPPRYNQREPQRVCEMCSCLLAPLQPYLVGALSRSVQPPVHDAIDAVSLRSWLNSPLSGSLEDDVYKATNILRTFMGAARLEPERQLPAGLLQGARGLALMSVLRVGAGWSATFGTGLVVARQRDGSWSPPCAAACYGVGWGAQIGGELADVLLVLRTDEALQAFCSAAHLGVCGSASAALGPVGRRAQAGLQVGAGGGGAVAGYSCSRGAFVGVAIEGSLFVVRDAANLAFYGYQTTARQLLVEGAVPQPPAASMLYEGLRSLMLRYETSGVAVHLPPQPAAAAAPVVSSPARVHAAADWGRAPEAAWGAESYHEAASADARGWGEPDKRREEPRREAAGKAATADAAAAAAAAPAEGLGGKAAAAAMRALRGAAAAGAAALGAARAGAGGGGEAAGGGGFITGSVAPDHGFSHHFDAPAAAAPAAAATVPPPPPAAASAYGTRSTHAAAWAPRGEEFRLPAAPRHEYERRAAAAADESEGECEYEPQLTWD